MDDRLRLSLLPHIVEGIQNAPLHLDPFPHFVVQDFFPKPVFEKILESLPPSELYGINYFDKSYTGPLARKRLAFKFYKGDIDKLADNYAQEFWTEIERLFFTPAIKEAVFKKLAKGFEFREEEKDLLTLAERAIPRTSLFKDLKGYAIRPHPDIPAKLVTLQISLAKDKILESLGTEYYAPSLNPLHLLRKPRGFSIQKTMSFSPNMAHAFCVINKGKYTSWHGRSRLSCPVPRDHLFINWYKGD